MGAFSLGLLHHREGLLALKKNAVIEAYWVPLSMKERVYPARIEL